MQHLSKTLRGLALLATTLLCLTACNDDELVPGGENGKYTIRISAGTSDNGTRTSLLSDGQVVWDEGDNFRVVTNGMSVDWNLNLTNGVGESRGEFEGTSNSSATPDGTAMAVYPYESLQNYKDKKLTISLSKTQKYAENSFDHKANIMMGTLSGSDGNYHVSFKNMMGVLQLKLTGDNITLSKITLTDNDGKNLWGTATVVYSNYESGIGCNSVTDGGCVLTLDCSGVTLTSEEKTFHFVVPTGVFEHGFEATIYDTNNRYQTISTSKANIIELNDVKAMPVLPINKLQSIEEFHIYNKALEAYMKQSGDPKFPRYKTNKDDTRGSVSTKGNSLINSSMNPWYDLADISSRYKYLDTPNSKILNIDQQASTVTLTDITKGKDIFRNRSKDDVTELVNMVPNHNYAYSIRDVNYKLLEHGEFKALDQVREVKINDSWNYRDLGGWPSTLGGKIKYEWIYRGGSLNGTWKTEVKNSSRTIGVASNYVTSRKTKLQLMDLGVKAELDLRATESDDDIPHKLSVGTENIRFGDAGLTWEWNYRNISSGSALGDPLNYPELVQDVKWIIEQVLAGHPVAYHCMSGADRTGIVSVIIEALLGVEEKYFARDYELTHFSSEYKKIPLWGKSGYRNKKASDDSETSKAFYYIFFSPKGANGDNIQKKAYNYLNNYFKDEDKKISKEKLDAFIEFMLEK